MARQSTAHWLEALERADIPVQRMNSLEDILRDPHLKAIGYFKPIEHPSEGALVSMKVPSDWSQTQPGYRRHAPRLGEHTREVLREAGYDDVQIDAMVKSGAARL
jgi:crotonobetainyl-CoA:carnitine CoA-transferase CaiB-like acyl-CoA transferase